MFSVASIPPRCCGIFADRRWRPEDALPALPGRQHHRRTRWAGGTTALVYFARMAAQHSVGTTGIARHRGHRRHYGRDLAPVNALRAIAELFEAEHCRKAGTTAW